ncbi:uncharacterized protein LOC135401426 [Ornithodoros turicata]|uniref:uncharacterized protein LOC135401426 n=1 Tax=Ornithodoros turicata TaxID=34597 RepID=UPI0031388ACD
MEIANLTNYGKMEEEDLRALAKEVVDLEVKIAERTRSQEERRDYHAMHNELTVGELKQEFPKGCNETFIEEEKTRDTKTTRITPTLSENFSSVLPIMYQLACALSLLSRYTGCLL